MEPTIDCGTTEVIDEGVAGDDADFTPWLQSDGGSISDTGSSQGSAVDRSNDRASRKRARQPAAALVVPPDDENAIMAAGQLQEFPGQKDWRATAIFLTYPRNDTRKEALLQKIKEQYSCALVVVSREQHEETTDGETPWHLHAFVKFPVQTRLNRATLDALGGGHGVHSLRVRPGEMNHFRTIAYVCKDGDYVAWPEGSELHYLRLAEQWRKDQASHIKKAKTSGLYAVLATEILNGATPDQLMSKYPGPALQNLSKLVAFYDAHVRVQAQRLEKPGMAITELREYSELWHEAYKTIFNWFKENLISPQWAKGSRPQRQPNLAVKCPALSGKSTLVRYLDDRFRCYHWPSDSNWHDDWNDARYDLIICDEFGGHCAPVNRFLQWTSGDIMKVNRRGMAPVEKRVHTPVIVLSMYSYDKWWENVTSETLEALRTRFLHANVPEEGPGCLMRRLIRTAEVVEQDD